MPCVCGQKVDRGQPKIQCAKCNIIFHLDCVNLLPADIEYMQKTNKQFKCTQCITVRRDSLRSPIRSDTQPPIAASATTPRDEGEKQKKDISLQAVFNELTGLRSENAHMLSLISSLISDKEALIKKVDHLQLEVQAVRRELHAYANSPTISDLASDVKNMRKEIKNQPATALNHADAKPANHLRAQLPAMSLTSPLPTRLPTSYSSVAAAGTTSQTLACSNISPSSQNNNAATMHLAHSSQSVMPENDEANFIAVMRKKNKKRHADNIVVGRKTSSELHVIAQTKWIHLSSFSPNVSEENIIDYVHSHANIDKKHLLCYKLVKKDAETANLKRISFKLGVAEQYLENILDPSLWQEYVRVRPFTNFPKRDVNPPQT